MVRDRFIDWLNRHGEIIRAAVSPPRNTRRPSISGSLNVNETLRATTGTWTGTQPITVQAICCGGAALTRFLDFVAAAAADASKSATTSASARSWCRPTSF